MSEISDKANRISAAIKEDTGVYVAPHLVEKILDLSQKEVPPVPTVESILVRVLDYGRDCSSMGFHAGEHSVYKEIERTLLRSCLQSCPQEKPK